MNDRRTSRWKRWLSLRGYGLVTSALFRAETPPDKMRARFERFGSTSRAALQRKHPKLVFADHRVGRLEIESVRAVDSPSCAMIYLHGGAFVFGSPRSYRERAMRISHRCRAEVFVPDYRLAPEHPFPAALDDALVAWQYVAALRPGLPVIISGDSAGGGLAVSLLLRLRELGAVMPAGAILLSPWTDLSISGASVEGNRGKDLWFTRRHLERWARYYVADADPHAPLLSPVFAELSCLPPLLVLAGEHELLLDDAQRLVTAAIRAGTTARLILGEGMQHDWPLTLPWLDESRAAWAEVSGFVERFRPYEHANGSPGPNLDDVADACPGD